MAAVKDVIKVFDYARASNIDLEVALEDIGMDPGSVSVEDLEGAGVLRCSNCGAWYQESELDSSGICAECRSKEK